MNPRILVIDDEESLTEILQFVLEKEGYDVDTANSAEEALDKDLTVYDLFIVDIMMGGMDGFGFAKAVRRVTDTENIPILFCSAMDDEDHIVRGLNIGGDDYITKPFVIGEVVARVKAILRRVALTSRMNTPEEHPSDGLYESDVTFRDLRIDRNDKVAYLDGEELPLTRTEFDILLFFLTHRNRIYSREEIIQQVWGADVVVTNRTIDTNITRLRKKLGPDYGQHIVTRQGFGYGFKETH